MTPTRYFFARIGKAFGLNRRQRRMTDAAAEVHLLREAEQVLGQSVWENVDGIEALGVEYWNLRRLMKERDQLAEKLAISEAELAAAHAERAAILGEKPPELVALEEERAVMVGEIDRLTRERDSVITKARDIRRVYDGLKMKLEVLAREGTPEVIAQTQARMTELKSGFSELKISRDRLTAELENSDVAFKELDEKVTRARQGHREMAAASFQQIGEANREISTLKARLGLIDTQTRQLYSDIGRHVSRYASSNEQCRKAGSDHIPLIDVMDALRTSVALNQRLADAN